MKYRWYLLLALTGTMFFATPLFAEGTIQPGVIDPSGDGQPGVTETCWVCKGTYNRDTGETRVWCGKPDSGGWGNKVCSIEAYDVYYYCQSYGDPCCVN